MTALAGWQNFYVIVGSSAGALVGLQFVALALISELPHTAGQAEAGDAFATPTIVHFATVLLLAAALCAPWQTIIGSAVFWGMTGAGGVVYSITIAARMRAQTAYHPQFEDWVFHCLLPIVGYVTLAASAVAAPTWPRVALFAVAAALLLLLVVGIHNAWDAVTYHVFVRRQKPGV